MSQHNHSAIILVATITTEADEKADFRGYLHLCDSTTSRETMVRNLLEHAGRPIISASHLYAVVAGPENPAYARAVTALGLTSLAACSRKIVTDAMEMLVMGELIPPDSLDDGTLAVVLESLFATQEDWDDLPMSSARAVDAWLADVTHTVGVEIALPTRSLLIGGLAVAMAKARADWSA